MLIHVAGVVDQEETDASGRYGCIHKRANFLPGSVCLQERARERSFPFCSWLSQHVSSAKDVWAS